jgi:hypothetical protein
MNFAYNFKNNCIFQLPFSSRTPLDFAAQGRAFLLGKGYGPETQDAFFNAFEKVIWFSYRRLAQCEDVGWGCMIRVIQMMVAQAITRDQPQLHPDAIIDLFREEKAAPLALTRICKLGQIGTPPPTQAPAGPTAPRSSQWSAPSSVNLSSSTKFPSPFRFTATNWKLTSPSPEPTASSPNC